MRSATDSRAWIRINGDLELPSRSLRHIADVGLTNSGLLSTSESPSSPKFRCSYPSRSASRRPTDQERLSTQWMISARRCHITSAFCTHYCINHAFSPVSSMDDHTHCVTHLAYLLFRRLLMKRFRDGGELNTLVSPMSKFPLLIAFAARFVLSLFV